MLNPSSSRSTPSMAIFLHQNQSRRNFFFIFILFFLDNRGTEMKKRRGVSWTFACSIRSDHIRSYLICLKKQKTQMEVQKQKQ